jgi:hypothetical protein
MLSGESLRKAFAMFDAEGKGLFPRTISCKCMCSHQHDTTLKIIDAVIMAQPDDTSKGERGSGRRLYPVIS